MSGTKSLIDGDLRTFFDSSISSVMEKIDVNQTDMICKKSELFTQGFLKDSNGEGVVNAPVHNIMHRFLRYSKEKGFNRSLILGGFGLGKTESICTGFVLHEIAKNPNIMCKIVHVSEEAAVSRCRAIRDIITKDDDFKRMAPHIIPTPIWGSKRFIVKRKTMSKDGTVEAYGVLSTNIGGRANLIVFDDPQDLKTAVLEPGTREKIEQVIKNIWLTRLIPSNSQVVVLMNKWHENDLASVIQRTPMSWSWMSVAVTEDLERLYYEDSFGRKKYMPLWDLFTKKDYLSKISEMGQRNFDRGYRLIPYSDSDRTFASFKNCCVFGVNPESIIEDERDWFFIGGLDIAGTKRPGTVLSVLAVHRQSGLKLPVYIDAMRSMSEVPNKMVQCFRKYGVDLFMVENNGVQDNIIDMLQSMLGTDKFKKYSIKIEGFQTGRNKADPIQGLPSIGKEMDNKEWMFCLDKEPDIGEDGITNPWYKMYFEFSNHPFYETTDIVMSLWFCRAGANTFLRGEEGPNIW